MGKRLGREREEPRDRFMPRTNRYKRWYSLKDTGKPFMMAKCFIAAICNFMFWWELYDAKLVANRMRVCSNTGKVWCPMSLQNHSYVARAES